METLPVYLISEAVKPQFGRGERSREVVASGLLPHGLGEVSEMVKPAEGEARREAREENSRKIRGRWRGRRKERGEKGKGLSFERR